jgi:hypothetical protein
MPWLLEDFKNVAAIAQSLATAISFAVGGVWIYQRYVRQQERYPHIESAADIVFVGEQSGFWVVELKGILENKGKVQHKISEFEFELSAIFSGDKVETSEVWRGQVDFARNLAKGSFLPPGFIFFIGPGIKAVYSYITRVPSEATFLIFHCRFKYLDKRNASHTAERTISVPRSGLTRIDLAAAPGPLGG